MPHPLHRHVLLCCFLVAVFEPAAKAQVQRSFLNLGFEQPALTAADAATGCYLLTADTQVPGWNTNHPTGYAAGGNCLSPTPVAGRMMELWRTNFNGVPARAGANFAELNAYVASRLYQDICLVNGERIRWQFSHRARSGTDVMSMNVDAGTNQIARASTTTAGVGTVVAGSCGGGSVGSATCSAPTTINTWADYTGAFTWTGTSAVHNVGFEAISTGSGTASTGNFLDDIQIFLTPYVEIQPTGAVQNPENAGSAAMQKVVVLGSLSSAITVQFSVAGSSTATLGSDFTTPTGTTSFSVTIPPGNYDGTAATGSLFDLGITILDDTLVENNETIVIDMLPNPAAYTLTSTTVCGGTISTTFSYTIVDNDVDLRTTKTLLGPSSTPPGGGSVQFQVDFQNNTARPTLAPLTAHDVPAAIADALPTGFTAFSWTCTTLGSPAPACPAASGTGPVAATVALPAGTGGAAGGVLRYTITGALAASQCTSTTNTATIGAAAGSTAAEATGVASGFTSPAVGGAANNSAGVSVDPLCADLQLTKTNTPGVNANVDQANDTVTSGGTTTYTIVITNSGPDAVTGAVVNDSSVSNLTCPAATVVTCTGGACPSGPLTFSSLGSGLTLGTLPTTAGANTVTLSFSCGVP